MSNDMDKDKTAEKLDKDGNIDKLQQVRFQLFLLLLILLFSGIFLAHNLSCHFRVGRCLGLEVSPRNEPRANNLYFVRGSKSSFAREQMIFYSQKPSYHIKLS